MNRKDFPILGREVYGRPLVYLDNAATTQKPRVVVEALTEMYYNANANVHRGVHFLSGYATDLHEGARRKVAAFIGARSEREIVFTRGTTEGINLVASSFGEAFLQEGDEVLVSLMEHHSNIVPWQLLAERRGIKVRFVPFDEQGVLDVEAFEKMLNERTKLVSLTHVSNVLGTVNPVKELISMAHKRGIPVLIDGAQAVAHMRVNVAELDADFYVFSGHKLYAPTGIGVLYGKEEWLRQLPPYQGGGEMIKQVHAEGSTYEEPPLRFEAGTPDYVATHALGVAIDYVQEIGMERIVAWEKELLSYVTECLSNIEGLRIVGTAPCKEAVVSFLLRGASGSEIHPLDVGTLLDRMGIAVRTGHHCAQPLLEHLGLESTVRASFAFYNTREEVDALFNGLRRIQSMF
jgi:cysteine desulfurase/selenocysteine lyase